MNENETDVNWLKWLIVCSPTLRFHAVRALSGIWRFALECLPVFMVLAKMGGRPTVDRLYLMAALPIQGVMILTFVQNQFVA